MTISLVGLARTGVAVVVSATAARWSPNASPAARGESPARRECRALTARLIIAAVLVLAAALCRVAACAQGEPDPVRSPGEVPRQLHRGDFPRRRAVARRALLVGVVRELRGHGVEGDGARLRRGRGVRGRVRRRRACTSATRSTRSRSSSSPTARASPAPRSSDRRRRPTCGPQSPSCAAPAAPPSPTRSAAFGLGARS